jgi:thioredoxin 1
MKNKKVYSVLLIVLIAFVGLGLKTILNQNVTGSTQEVILPEDKPITNNIKVTFVELGSVGCIPCDKMQPILKEIAREYQGQVEVVFYDVKTPAGKPYAEEFQVRAIPTQVFLDKEGKEYFRHLGFFPKEEVVNVLQQQGVR